MAKNENSVKDQVQEVVEAVAGTKPTFFQKYKVAIVAAIAFGAGALVEAVGAGFVQRKQLNLIDSSDPLVEISEPIE